MAGGVPVGERGVPALCEEPCQQPLMRPVEDVQARALQQMWSKKWSIGCVNSNIVTILEGGEFV